MVFYKLSVVANYLYPYGQVAILTNNILGTVTPSDVNNDRERSAQLDREKNKKQAKADAERNLEESRRKRGSILTKII